MIDVRVSDLLDGPRGRRVCLALAFGGQGWSWPSRPRADQWSALATAMGSVRDHWVSADLVEDEVGWPAARTWPVQVRPGARVLEIRGAIDWTALVARHPLDVTASCRHDWFRCTGRVGDWLLPDWGSVAAEVDAVHVPVGAWLALAGRPLDVTGTRAATVLTGWDPDTTWWLTDVVESGDPTDWVRTGGGPARPVALGLSRSGAAAPRTGRGSGQTSDAAYLPAQAAARK
ncbi:hypothetical protein TEK04_06120 [Klenkia sp. LSe6-5]|uniref:Uncharacterized protein n=1 Tax=Klenkia sesuvii TaxID=3103137 RepID=A0ABU8DU03_9ACTN